MCLGARALPVEPLLAVDRRLLGYKRVGVMSHKVCESAIRLYFKNPKMSSIFRTMSRRSSDSQDTVANSEEINYPKIQNDLDDWKLPKVSNQEIYKK